MHEIKGEFLRRTGVADHPFTRIFEKTCCDIDPMKHLGANGLPWQLPSEKEMRSLLDDSFDGYNEDSVDG